MDVKPRRHLVVITGPVAAGKTTVAHALGNALRKAGLKTGVVDLDELYCMARQVDGFGDFETWEIARRSASTLADSFYKRGFELVVVEGGVHSESEYADLRTQLEPDVQETFVTLLVSAEEALRRAHDDPHPDRVFSRRPDVQELLYSEFRKALPFLEEASDILLADEVGAEDLARSILDLVLGTAEDADPGHLGESPSRSVDERDG